MQEDRDSVRFSPASCRDEEASEPSVALRYLRPGIIAGALLLMLFHIELGLGAAAQAPEQILVQVLDDEGRPESAAQCYADIISGSVNEKKQPLRSLDSLYDLISPRAFQASTDKGFHVLETGFTTMPDEFEIRIVCYAPGLSGVSYTIINNENTQACSIKEDGRLLLCNN